MRQGLWIVIASSVAFGACGNGTPASPALQDGGSVLGDASTLPSDTASDAAMVAHASDASMVSDSSDASMLADASDDVSSWALYTVSPGGHTATLAMGAAGNPDDGLVSGKSGRDYRFAFDSSAAYTIVTPAEPNDQLDWNKLPGISDCGEVDLSVDGVMFGWRWRLDLVPQVLEVTAYANDSSKHLSAQPPLLTLDAGDLASVTPLRYRIWIDGANYGFSIGGVIRGRTIDAATTLPRECAGTAPSTLAIQWAASFYFGGTSTSPSKITGRVFEIPFH